ncbi:MAG: GGDEF domain-containing protein [Butyrivibrio sp.]|nr:GGDEF domain-containing protein [Butyrivibrio sp.]
MDNAITKNNTSQDQQIKGLRINNLNYIFIIGLLCLTALLFIISTSQSSEYKEGTDITDEYHRIEEDSRMVQAASDYLTKNVQFFVMTGKVKYLNDYFQEANETKRREKAIEDLNQMKDVDSLVILLEESVKKSMELMQLEYKAMRCAAEGYGLDLSSLPEEIQNTPLPEEASSMTDQEKVEYAQNIIFGPDYEEYKNQISEYETQYLEKASVIMDVLQTDGRQDMKRLLFLQRAAIFIIAVLGIVLFFAIARMVVHPLKHAVHHMAGGERIFPLDGTYEIRYMSNTYNGFHSDSVAIQKQLKQDAQRDALTGVLNRRGYHTVIDRLALESFPMALLVMDIDNFKTINDNYGHSAGDAALKKVATLLLSTFRNTDITSRIGGDEFTVILSEVTIQNKETIEKKINLINESLQNPGSDDEPRLSISVGCAFSDSGYTEHLFNEADANMYD